ncbi:uncharacterized protein LOC112520864 [Cynara cardunculus var. scolymus]|uniref:Uncharacterized protein n=1 Tax=Cynara cardunculus var. scolymus TaxID=59895 RepID=A0A103XHV3_CYNCS|nr:uncharacterized protein LOC112520864 [Cynara cardunculus var. scolymus]KVH91010.1 hypothetical protein Ccrd_006950 [Cynara cardunculus var. scolymus]
MVSLETTPPPPPPATASPRISFSGDFLDDANFICITPQDKEKEIKTRTGEFEFLSGDLSSPATMLTADELFFEGKLLPFWQNEKLNKINIKPEKVVAKEAVTMKEDENNNNNKMSWFIDEDPSPRPPKCTVLWKELLRLKKQRTSSVLSPSSSTSSNSSSNSIDDQDSSKKEKQQQVKRIKQGLERTRSSGIKIRPMINPVNLISRFSIT